MKCIACGLENMPGSLQCFECGRGMSNFLIPIELPKLHSSTYRLMMSILTGFLSAIKVTISTLLKPVRWGLYLTLFWIPGMIHLFQERYSEGLLYLFGVPISLILGMYLFNNWVSNILLPLGLLSYLWSLTDGYYSWQEERKGLVKSKVSRIRVLLFCSSLISVMTVIWAPHTLIMQLKRDDLKPGVYEGDRLFVDTRPHLTGRFERGQLIVIDLPTNTTIARIIGLPGDNIKVRNDHVYLGDKELDDKFARINGTEEDRDIQIPEGQYLILANLAGKNLTDYNNIWTIDGRDAIGHIYAVIGPTKHRRLLD